MSETELPPKTESEDQEAIEIIAKDEEAEPPAEEHGENVGDDEKREDTYNEVKEEGVDSKEKTEGNAEEAVSTTDENVTTEGALKDEGTDQPLDVENIGEVLDSEAGQIEPTETSDAQQAEELTETQKEEIIADADGTATDPVEGLLVGSTGIFLTGEGASTSNVEGESENHLVPEVEAHPLDDLTDAQVIEVVNEVEMENRHLELENILFENFLKENDASLLDGIEEIMSFLIKRSSFTHGSSNNLQDKGVVPVDRQKLRIDSYTSITSIAEGKGPKINLSQKTDMVTRAMEENQASLESFLKKSHIAMRNLRSELEEFSIREAEIKEATDIFEFSVVTQGLDKLTQRIPAEKFVRYMEEWLKSAQLQIEKLRLRIATLKVQYKKVSQQLIQRQELGENVHAVDFDQLEIENKHFIEKIEQKNNHLVELKKMNGGANLVLSTHKKYLQKQQDEYNKLREQIESKNLQIEITERECTEAEEELNEIFQKHEHCKKLKNQYTVPDVMEYVRLKGKLHDLRKNMKIWIRRRKIQDIALNTCLRQMKNLTGRTNIDPDWFEERSMNSDSSEGLLM